LECVGGKIRQRSGLERPDVVGKELLGVEVAREAVATEVVRGQQLLPVCVELFGNVWQREI